MSRVLPYVRLCQLLAVLLLAACSLPTTDELPGHPIQLQVSLEAGDTFAYQIEMEQVMVGHPSVEQTAVTSAIVSFEVIEVNGDGSYLLEASYDWLAFSDSYWGLWYNSAELADFPDYAFLADVIGQPFRVRLEWYGGLSEVEGLEELVAEALADVDDPEVAALWIEALNSPLSYVFVSSYPVEAVHIGDSWRTECEPACHATFTLEARDDVHADLKMALREELVEQDSTNVVGMEVYAGAIQTQLATGLVSHAAVEVRLVGQLGLAGMAYTDFTGALTETVTIDVTEVPLDAPFPTPPGL